MAPIATGANAGNELPRQTGVTCWAGWLKWWASRTAIRQTLKS